MVNWFFGKDAKAIQQEKNRLLANGAGKTEYPHAEEWNWTFNLYYVQKLT